MLTEFIVTKLTSHWQLVFDGARDVADAWLKGVMELWGLFSFVERDMWSWFRVWVLPRIVLCLYSADSLEFVCTCPERWIHGVHHFGKFIQSIEMIIYNWIYIPPSENDRGLSRTTTARHPSYLQWARCHRVDLNAELFSFHNSLKST